MIKNKSLIWLLFLGLIIILLNGSCSKKSDIPDVDDNNIQTTTTTEYDPGFQISDESAPISYIPTAIRNYTLIKREEIDDDSARGEFQNDNDKVKYQLDITLYEDKDRANLQAVVEPAKKYSQDATTNVINKTKVYAAFDKDGVYYMGWVTKFNYAVKIIATPPKELTGREELRESADEFLTIIEEAISEAEKSL